MVLPRELSVTCNPWTSSHEHKLWFWTVQGASTSLCGNPGSTVSPGTEMIDILSVMQRLWLQHGAWTSPSTLFSKTSSLLSITHDINKSYNLGILLVLATLVKRSSKKASGYIFCNLKTFLVDIFGQFTAASNDMHSYLKKRTYSSINIKLHPKKSCDH